MRARRRLRRRRARTHVVVDGSTCGRCGDSAYEIVPSIETNEPSPLLRQRLEYVQIPNALTHVMPCMHGPGRARAAGGLQVTRSRTRPGPRRPAGHVSAVHGVVVVYRTVRVF